MLKAACWRGWQRTEKQRGFAVVHDCAALLAVDLYLAAMRLLATCFLFLCFWIIFYKCLVHPVFVLQVPEGAVRGAERGAAGLCHDAGENQS